MSVLSLLVRASAQSHDKPRLEAERKARLKALYPQLPYPPSLSPRLRKLSENPENLKPMDADALVDAAAAVIGWTGHDLSPDLQALTLVVARLGGVGAASQIGLLAMAELQARTAGPRARLP